MMSNIIAPTIGGVLIGISSTILLYGIGRISGISGIFGSLVTSFNKENTWRVAWILGLLVGGWAMLSLYPHYFDYQFSFSKTKLIIAGLLVGFGTRLGSGCTSGHGVCGLGRRSMRSLVAVVTFMASGIVVVAVENLIK